MLYELVTDALDQEWSLPCGLGAAEPDDQRDALLTLLAVHDLTTASLSRVGRRVRWQGHPDIAALKWRLEDSLEAHLDALIGVDGPGEPVAADEVADVMRALAARDRCPPRVEVGPGGRFGGASGRAHGGRRPGGAGGSRRSC